jgi:bifunctional non-homologous end joining protein LigD
VHLWSRTGRNWAKDFPLIADAIARLPVESVILDGEAVCLLEDGRPDFHALRSRKACRDARLIAYDLLALNGEDLRKMPLHERRKRLDSLLTTTHSVSPATSRAQKARLCSSVRAR